MEFSFQSNPKNLDLSYKMDLDPWDCIIAKFQRTDLVICGHSREGKTPSHSQIDTVLPVPHLQCMSIHPYYSNIFMQRKTTFVTIYFLP